MIAGHPTWIRLPPDRKGAKCPVSGWCRRKITKLLFGVPSQGIPGKVKYKHVPGDGPNSKGTIFVNVPSLLSHMVGEAESSPQDIAKLQILSQSPDWCQAAVTTLISLTSGRAGLTLTDALHYLTLTDGTGTDSNPQGPPDHARRRGRPPRVCPA